MSVPELRACSPSDGMKPEQKVVKSGREGHDSFANISQEIEKELSFPRASESSVQWLQFLHALDQQGSSNFSNGPKVNNGIEGKEHDLDLFNGLNSFHSDLNVKESVQSLRGSGDPMKGTRNTSQQVQALNIPEAVVAFVQAAAKANGEPEKYIPGWPLLSPSKVQLQKCEKCAREFCSTINYRRHIRVHRRSLKIDKESPKNRGLLGAFWDKLSLDDAKEILSFKDAGIEDVTGSLVIKLLASLFRKPGIYLLPVIYAKAGMTLMELVQESPLSHPISSQELFGALDDASEKTFLCAGTALSMQKFVFDGKTEKVALEMKNLIACASFMLEQKLVKAWVADKDTEALRCQKLLVEEEEAAQRRQAEFLERKRLKKLRLKVQKEKESIDSNKYDLRIASTEIVESWSGSSGIPSPTSSSESHIKIQETSLNNGPLLLESGRIPGHYVETCTGEQHVHVEGADQNLYHQFRTGSCQQSATDLRLHLHPEDVDHNVDHGLQRGTGQQQPAAAHWKHLYPARNAQNGSYLGHVPLSKGSVMMKHGSYKDPKGVTLANGNKVWTRKIKPENLEGCANDRGADRECSEQEHKEQTDLCNKCAVQIGSINIRLKAGNGPRMDAVSLQQNDSHQQLAKPDFSLDGVNRSEVKLWRPVGHQFGGSVTITSVRGVSNVDEFGANTSNRDLPDSSCPASGVTEDDRSGSCKDSSTALESADFCGPSLFSSLTAEAFLSQRWKEAIAADHVMLALSPETETSDCHLTREGSCAETSPLSLDCCHQSSVESADNQIAGTGSFDLLNSTMPKLAKPDKSYRMKYVPKQRNKG